VLLGGKGRTERDDVLGEGFDFERDVCPMGQNVPQLVRVVWRENDFFLAETRFDTWIQEVGEFEIVRDPDDRHAGVVQRGIHTGEVIEDVIPAFLDEFVDFVEHDDRDPLHVIDSLEKRRVHAVGRPASHRDRLHLLAIEFQIPDLALERPHRVELTILEG
jgi:hypothetical protein